MDGIWDDGVRAGDVRLPLYSAGRREAFLRACSMSAEELRRVGYLVEDGRTGHRRVSPRHELLSSYSCAVRLADAARIPGARRTLDRCSIATGVLFPLAYYLLFRIGTSDVPAAATVVAAAVASGVLMWFRALDGLSAYTFLTPEEAASLFGVGIQAREPSVPSRVNAALGRFLRRRRLARHGETFHGYCGGGYA